ncbi:flavoprotein [Polymorphospora sp. NPDC050346]|uniref:flavoprotein n=1 Tax=Polymorphospora sp. NPDC050346 TaxID=3155780 RepID=UPI0033D53FC4
MTTRTLCVIVCGAGPAPHVGTLVDLAHTDGWTVRIVATPAGLDFIDTDALGRQTGTPVRSDYRPRQPRTRRSRDDAVLIAPATYNTVNKLALGINDTYALNVAAEAIGRRTPTVLLPFVNQALAARRPFHHAVEALRGEGVAVLLGPGGFTPHPPGTGDEQIARFPWHAGLAAVQQRSTATPATEPHPERPQHPG